MHSWIIIRWASDQHGNAPDRPLTLSTPELLALPPVVRHCWELPLGIDHYVLCLEARLAQGQFFSFSTTTVYRSPLQSEFDVEPEAAVLGR